MKMLQADPVDQAGVQRFHTRKAGQHVDMTVRSGPQMYHQIPAVHCSDDIDATTVPVPSELPSKHDGVPP